MAKRRTYKRMVMIPLNEADMQVTRKECVDAMIELRKAKRALEAAKKVFNDQKKELKKVIDAACDELESGEAEVLMELYAVFIADTEKVDEYRADTDTLVCTRDARPEELQMKMAFEAHDEEKPDEFAAGNLVTVTNVPSAKWAIYQVKEIRDQHGNKVADLDLAVRADAEDPPEALRGIAVAYLEAATMGPKMDPPAAEPPADAPDPAAPAPDGLTDEPAEDGKPKKKGGRKKAA